MKTQKGLKSFFAILAFTCTSFAETPPPIALEVEALFEKSCYGCHGQPGYKNKAGLDIKNYNYLIDNFLLVPGGSDLSLMFDYISSGDMPPPGDLFPDGGKPYRPAPSDIELVKKWIDEGAPSWETDTGPIEVISYKSVLEKILKDVQSLDAVKARQVRYISIAHLVGAGVSEVALEQNRKAIFKLLNSLSLAPTIYTPKAIDKDRLIFQIHLPQIKWLTNTWARLDFDYPVEMPLEDTLTKKIVKATRGDLPFIHGDWFVEFASRPDLYHGILYTDLMGIGGATEASAQVEKFLGLNRIDNILNGRTFRGGFTSSGVSVNNRIIERHEIESYSGAYWMSYDFSGNSLDPELRQNIFGFPLGPAEAFENSQETFLHAGGEVIFNLPNGMQAYLLLSSTDDRLDKAPTDIVLDPNRPDGAVENAVSCFRCHNQGIIQKKDLIGPYIVSNKNLFIDDFAVLTDIYRDNDLFIDHQQKDALRFLRANKELNIKVNEPEPVTEVVQKYENDMSLKQLSAEFYLDAPQLVKKIESSENLTFLLGPLKVPGATIKREFILENYRKIINEIYKN